MPSHVDTSQHGGDIVTKHFLVTSSNAHACYPDVRRAFGTLPYDPFQNRLRIYALPIATACSIFFLTVMLFATLTQVHAQSGSIRVTEKAHRFAGTVSACNFEGVSADAQIASAFKAIGGTGAVDASCYGHKTVTLALPIILKQKQMLKFSPDTEFRPASDDSTLVNMSPGAQLDGLTADLSTHPHYSGHIVHLTCTDGAPGITTNITNIVVRGANSAYGTALGMYCERELAGLAFVSVSHLSSFGLANPIVLSVSAPGAWINGNNFHDLHLVGPANAPITGISMINAGLEIRGNIFTGLQIEGNGVKNSFGINLRNTGSQMIRANVFEGSMWDLSHSWEPPAHGVMGNMVMGDMDTSPVDNGDNTVFDLFDVHPGLQTQELTIARHLDQAGSGSFAGTCTMNDTTSCTFRLASPFVKKPICIATIQSSQAMAAGCMVDGTAVTITAVSRNTNVWGAVLIGNPQ